MTKGFARGSRLLVGALALAASVASAAVPTTPTRWVTDEAGFLSPAARQTLDARLEGYQQSTGHQMLVWIGQTSDGVPIEEFANTAFTAWRVGRQGLDDGLVLFLLAQDRKVRVEVGYGLEAKVPDAVAARIIRDLVVPRIQAGDHDGAVEAGVGALLSAADGGASEAVGRPSTTTPGGRAPRPALTTGQKVVFGLVALAFLILFITNPSLAIYLLFSILSGGRGGGGGGGGGGFSGGGGRSGGGGASGSW